MLFKIVEMATIMIKDNDSTNNNSDIDNDNNCK